MPRSNRVYHNQTTDIFDEHDNPRGGGRGWRLVDLNVPLPPYPPDELTKILLDMDIQCEFPECDAQAFGSLKVATHVAFLCNWHLFTCTEGPKDQVHEAQADLMYAMLERIYETTYGRTRLMSIEEKLALPLPTPQSTAIKETLPPMKPRFGQL